MRYLLCGFAGMFLVAMTGFAGPFEDAQKAFDEKQYPQAIKLLDEYLKDKKDDAKAYLLRGRAHTRSQNTAQAIADFTKTIELDPKAVIAYTGRGQIYGKDDKTRDKAIADYSKAIELEPNVHWHRLDRGNLHLKGNNPPDFDKAYADFDAAIKINAKSANAYGLRAQAVLAKGAQWSTFKQGDQVFLRITGYQRTAMQDALPDLNKALDLNPKLTEHLRRRAEVYYHLHDEPKELADLKALVALVKNDAETFNRLGWVLATSADDKLLDPKAALDAAKKAVELTSEKKPHILDTLAAAQAAAGNYKDAVATQQRVIEMFQAPPKSEFHARLDLYKQNKPFRETPARVEPKQEPKKDPKSDTPPASTTLSEDNAQLAKAGTYGDFRTGWIAKDATNTSFPKELKGNLYLWFTADKDKPSGEFNVGFRGSEDICLPGGIFRYELVEREGKRLLKIVWTRTKAEVLLEYSLKEGQLTLKGETKRELAEWGLNASKGMIFKSNK